MDGWMSIYDYFSILLHFVYISRTMIELFSQHALNHLIGILILFHTKPVGDANFGGLEKRKDGAFRIG
jgi:hypothetical protein